MNSIVIHYKELALKGKNRPWFIQMLVRNIKTALAGLHVASVRSSMGRIELELRPDSPREEVNGQIYLFVDASTKADFDKNKTTYVKEYK